MTDKENLNSVNNGYKYDEIAVHYKSLEELIDCHTNAEKRLKEILENSPDIDQPDFIGHKFIIDTTTDNYCLVIELYKHY